MGPAMRSGRLRPAPMAPRLRLALACLIGALLALAAAPAPAHFQLNINIRIIQVEHLNDGLRVYLRLPMPYLLAGLVGEPRADGSAEAAPYTWNRMIDGQLMHYFDAEAFRSDPRGLGALAAAGHRVFVEGRKLEATLEDVRAYPGLRQPPFASLAEAKRAFESQDQGRAGAEPLGEVFVGDMVVDVVLRYRTDGTVQTYRFGGALDPGLPGQEETANVLLDHYPGQEPLVFRLRGLLHEPIEVTRSRLAAAATFVVEGVRHILEGTDHVLFVLCLTVGALGMGALLWRVTGFTLGHTVTLIAGFFGFVPQGAWFIPAVEAGIALSIVYAGLIAVLGRPSRATVAITTAIGLLHGLGFSFVLHEILQVDSPNLWQSLLAFNLGVELGQVAIVLVSFPAIVLLARRNARLGAWGRAAVALPCIGIASVWTGQRLLMLAETL